MLAAASVTVHAARTQQRRGRVIIGQDARVVMSQPQAPTTEVHDERLVQADLPIAQFRKEVRRRLRVVQA